MLAVTLFWTFWGTLEMYHEGWWGSGPGRLLYLAPASTCTVLALLGQRWPLVGGCALIGASLWFTAWWLPLSVARGSELGDLAVRLAIAGTPAAVGTLFLLEARRRRGSAAPPASRWIVRHLGSVLSVVAPVLMLLGISAVRLPTVLSRFDDGDRGAKVIAGPDGPLVWAPEGPGWSAGAGEGRDWRCYPSWNRLALYGMEPVGLGDKPDRPEGPATMAEMQRYGLFRYLDADGTTLHDVPVDVWRMPTVRDLVGCLVRDGVGVGATWHGDVGRATFTTEPDKETPLWAPDRSPIYYWALDDTGATDAFYVSYNGWVGKQPKSFGNSRHGFRFIRSP
ncbi:MAG: hypothetical protein AAF628_28195 [Planctomycetota bacterium]